MISRLGVQPSRTQRKGAPEYPGTRVAKTYSLNGFPALVAPGVTVPATAPVHVVYTRAASGEAELWVDGVRRAARHGPGTFADWDARYPLAIGSEIVGDRTSLTRLPAAERDKDPCLFRRSWLGVLHLVAVYDRARARRSSRTAGST